MSCTISRSIGQRSRSPGSFKFCGWVCGGGGGVVGGWAGAGGGGGGGGGVGVGDYPSRFSVQH